MVATAAHANLSGGNGNDIIVATSRVSTLDGGAGSDLLLGTAGNDALIGGAGINTMWGGAGNDTFKFSAGFGKDTILDLHPGKDVIEISNTIFANFVDLIAHSSDDGHGNTVITADASNSITLKTVPFSTLHAADFHFI